MQPALILDTSLARLACDQDQVLRRDQLARVGVSRGQVDAQLDGRRWRAVGGLVVVLHNGPLTRSQQMWAAVLHCGHGAALCARSSLEVVGLEGWEDDTVHVLVRRGTTVPPLREVAVKVHESRRYAPDDVHPTRFPPMTRVERAAVDAACWSRNPRTACGLLAAVVQQRLSTAPRLREALLDAGQVRHCRLLLAALNDIEGGAHALSEIDFGRFCRRYRLPAPSRQQIRSDRTGRRRYLDVTLDGPAGPLHVEIDGAMHLLVRTYWDDMERDNEFVIARERRLRFPAVAVYVAPERVADQIRRAL